MRSRIGKAGFGLLAVLFWSLTARAQIDLYGVDLRSSGNFNVGYSGAFGDVGSSSHSLSLGGQANINGSYFSPSFLSFNIEPFYDRAQDNSESQSLINSRGVNSTLNLFGGSHFPGSIGYNADYNSTGLYGLPGSSGLLTHGNTDQFSLNWAVLMPHLPIVTIGYSDANSTSTLYGLDTEGKSNQKNFTLGTNFSWEGFRLNAGFNHFTNNNLLPSFTAPGETVRADSSSNQFQFSGSHSLPTSGSVSFSLSRTNYHYHDEDGGTSPSTSATGTNDSADAAVSLHPAKRLTLTFTSDYTDNAVANFTQQILSQGGVAPETSLGTIRSLLVGGTAFTAITSRLYAQATVSRQEQYFLGQSYGATLFAGNVGYNYTHALLGSLTFSLGLVDSATQLGNTGAGLVGSVNFSRKVGRWDLAANYIYAQNVQTLLSLYTTSSSVYAANVGRRIGDHLNWFGGYSGARTGITNTRGYESHSDRFYSSVSYRRYNVNGSWSKSHGESLVTPTGLVSIPTNLPPGILSENEIVAFNANSYSLSVSGSPMRRLSITAGFSKGTGGTNSLLSNISNDTEVRNALLRYQFRKLYFNAGYTRFKQSLGVTTTNPSVVSSYYFGISRWFNIF